MVGIVGDGLKWRFVLLHKHLKREEDVKSSHNCVVYHDGGGVVAAVSSKTYELDISSLMSGEMVPASVVSFFQVLLGALSLGAKQLRVNTFASSICDNVDSLPNVLCEFGVPNVATFRITAYVCTSKRHAVVEADAKWQLPRPTPPVVIKSATSSAASTTSVAVSTTSTLALPTREIGAVLSASSSIRRIRRRVRKTARATPSVSSTSAPPTSARVGDADPVEPATRRHGRLAPAVEPAARAEPATVAPAPTFDGELQLCERVVLKLPGKYKNSIDKERDARQLLSDGGNLIDGIVPILSFPRAADMPFIVMPNCGVDLDSIDLTDERMRDAVVRAFGAFEKTLHAIHAKKHVVFDLWPRNILVQRVVDTKDKLEVKLWLVDLESMLAEGEPCSGTPQLHVTGFSPQVASAADDMKRWRWIQDFVEHKGAKRFGSEESTE